MKDTKKTIDGTRLTWPEILNLQEIEGSPIDPEQIAMFEMFEREGWDHPRRIDYILQALYRSRS
jgi:hypothetical protein